MVREVVVATATADSVDAVPLPPPPPPAAAAVAENVPPPALLKPKRPRDWVSFTLVGGGAEVWAGNCMQLGDCDSPFSRLTANGRHWIFKNVNRMRGGPTEMCGPHKPLGLSLVAEALSLDCTTGVLAASLAFGMSQKHESLWLEGAISPALDGGLSSKSTLLWDVHEQGGRPAATSLFDLIRNDDKKAELGNVTDEPFQQLGLLVIFARIYMVNTDDILVKATTTGGYDLVYGDAKKAFCYFPNEHEVPRARPLDYLFRRPLSSVKCAMEEDDNEDDSSHSEEEDGERFERDPFMPWENRPLAEAVAQVIASWSDKAIDAALDAERRSLSTLNDAASTAESANIGEQPAEPLWRKHYKEQALDLVRCVRGGERPSMREVSALFALPRGSGSDSDSD